MKFYKKGFTLIEVMIIVAIIGILASIVVPAIFPSEVQKARQENIIRGYNGTVEQRCLNGFKHTINSQGHVQQTISATGTGVACETN